MPSHSRGFATRLAIIAAALLYFAAVDAHAQASVLGYDPDADPFQLLREAEAEAAREDKLVLVIAGGDWCIWCHYLDRFLKANPDIDYALKQTFAVVKVYFEEEGDNQDFFAAMPEAVGYPHFWVRSADGDVLASENTLPLENGDKSYDGDAVTAFIERWRESL
jgi:hypothetical protein